MALPTVTIPAGAKQISVSFIVGQLDGSSCGFYLWDTAGKTPAQFGESSNSQDTFVIPGAPGTLRGREVQWDFSIFSYTGGTDEPYAVTVTFLADGAVIGAMPDTGTFTKHKSLEHKVQLV